MSFSSRFDFLRFYTARVKGGRCPASRCFSVSPLKADILADHPRSLTSAGLRSMCGGCRISSFDVMRGELQGIGSHLRFPCCDPAPVKVRIGATSASKHLTLIEHAPARGAVGEPARRDGATTATLVREVPAVLRWSALLSTADIMASSQSVCVGANSRPQCLPGLSPLYLRYCCKTRKL
jgi:hypothetical protein